MPLQERIHTIVSKVLPQRGNRKMDSYGMLRPRATRNGSVPITATHRQVAATDFERYVRG
jgi:hypothetical protein